MNFLAHFHIAEKTSTCMTGALLGDFVKGHGYIDLPHSIQMGVLLHRRVDTLSESMPHLQQLRKLFPQGERRYLGIVSDMLIDHLLSQHWQSFHTKPLATFANSVYQQLLPMPGAFPTYEKVRINMSQYNWLCHYHTTDQILYALERISKRLKRPFELAQLGEKCLNQHYALLESAIAEDYPKLMIQLKEELQNKKSDKFI